MIINCPTCGQSTGIDQFDVESLLDIPLPKIHAEIVDKLVSDHPLGTLPENLYDFVYFHDPDGGPEGGYNTLRTHIAHLRKGLRHYGWDIPLLRGRSSVDFDVSNKRYRLEKIEEMKNAS